ncbi:MAG: DUF2325 domain-containing protein [Moorellales bacterium]
MTCGSQVVDLQNHLRELERACRQSGISTEVDADSPDFWLFACVSACLAALAWRKRQDVLVEMLRRGPFRPSAKLLDRKTPLWKVCQRMLEDFPGERAKGFFRHFIAAGIAGLREALEQEDYAGFAAALRARGGYPEFQIYFLARAYGEKLKGVPEPAPEDAAVIARLRQQYFRVCLEYRLRKSGKAPPRLRPGSEEAYLAEIRRLQEKLARAGERVSEASALVELAESERRELVLENERLRQEIAGLHEEYGRRIAFLEAELARLRRQNVALGEGQKARSLEGARVCVVGDPHRAPAYREILERWGAEMDFVDGYEDKGRAGEAAAAADGVIVVTAYCCHAIYETVKAEARRRRRPLALANSAGEASFSGAVENLAEQIGKEGEPVGSLA